MVSIEKLIYNSYFCYSPIALFALAIGSGLMQLIPTRCLFSSLSEECLVYYPLNIINLIFITYNILYLYYNIILKHDTVGKSVKRIYRKTIKHYRIRKKSERIRILLFCYITSLVLSYFRFATTLIRAIY